MTYSVFFVKKELDVELYLCFTKLWRSDNHAKQSIFYS